MATNTDNMRVLTIVNDNNQTESFTIPINMIDSSDRLQRLFKLENGNYKNSVTISNVQINVFKKFSWCFMHTFNRAFNNDVEDFVLQKKIKELFSGDFVCITDLILFTSEFGFYEPKEILVHMLRGFMLTKSNGELRKAFELPDDLTHEEKMIIEERKFHSDSSRVKSDSGFENTMGLRIETE